MNIKIMSMALLIVALNIHAQPVVSLSNNAGVWTKIMPNRSPALKGAQIGPGDFVDRTVTSAKLLASVCPNNAADFSVVWLPWRSSVMAFWAEPGTPQTNRVSLIRFFPITAGDWSYLAVNPSASVPMSLGNLSASSDVQRGNRVVFSFSLRGGPFSLAGIGMTITSSDGNSLNHRLNVTSYSQEYVGQTIQGNPIASGAATQITYGLDAIGPAVGYGASTQADLDQIRDWVAANNSATAPYTITCNLQVTNTSGVRVVHLTRRLTFLAKAAPVAISAAGVSVMGTDNFMYQLESTSKLVGGRATNSIWTPVGLPTVSGAIMPVPDAPSVMFFRARQGQQ